ncbi:MAG TPA: MFS transporter [Anaerolineales bacterium]|nr:MFS transporter [Anaerolineales bacterium]
MIRVPPALTHRNFALLWSGLLISLVGSQMQQWALFWHISQLSKDPIAVSVVGAVRFAAVLCFSLWGGLVADRHNRRNILFFTQATAMLVALLLGLLTLTQAIQLWHIYLLTGMQAIAMAFDLPARQALVPNLVPRDILPSAFSLQSIAFNTGAILGPALSGIVIGYLGQAATYFINAVSFLAVMIALFLLQGVHQQPSEIKKGFRAALIDIRDGVRFIRHQPLILSTMILDFIATFFSSANTLLPYFSQNVLHVGEVAYGWLAAAQSVGAVTVGLVASQYSRIQRQGPLLLAAVVVFGLATILFGTARTYVLVFIALIMIGAADSVSTIIRNTIRQLITPDSLRGRMTSINQIFFMGGPQLGEIEAGAVAKFFGVPFAIISGGIGAILGVVLVSSIWPSLARYSGDEPASVTVPSTN